VAQEQNLDPEHSWAVICMNQQAVFVRSADAASARHHLVATQTALQNTVEQMQAKIRDLASETNAAVDANRIDSLVDLVQSKTSLFTDFPRRFSDEASGLLKHLSEVEVNIDSFHKGLRKTNAVWQSEKSFFNLEPMHPRLSDEVMGLFKHLSEAEEKADSFQKRLRETKWEVEKSVHSFDEMLRWTNHLTTDELEVELSDWQHTTFHQPLVCRVRAEPEIGMSGMTLTVSISKRGAEVAGILVILESEKDTITELTDERGKVVFPAASGSAVLRLGKTEIALDLEP
jgi:phage shock protein A